MSSYFARKIYDQCVQNNRINAETAPGSYKLEPSQLQYGNCILTNNSTNAKSIWYGGSEKGHTSHLSDIESHLKNLDIPDSKCLEGRTMIEKNLYAKSLIANYKSISETCNKQLDPQFSRLELPVTSYKSKTQTRFGFPIINPSEFVYYGTVPEQYNNNRFGINSRLVEKDKLAIKA
jgi:hypothetical protein